MEHLTGVYGQVLTGAIGAALGAVLVYLFGEMMLSLMAGPAVSCLGLY